MAFDGTPRSDGFCLKRSAKTCTRPYGVTISSASLSGAPAENYCGIDQVTTTCEAVVDMVAGESCSSAEDCGCERDGDGACIGTGQGGLCETVGGLANTCTIPCAVAGQCPTVLTCDDMDPYCH